MLSLSPSLYGPWGPGYVRPLPPHASVQPRSLAGMNFLVGGLPTQARFYTAKKRSPPTDGHTKQVQKQCSAVTKAEARVGRGLKGLGFWAKNMRCPLPHLSRSWFSYRWNEIELRRRGSPEFSLGFQVS